MIPSEVSLVSQRVSWVIYRSMGEGLLNLFMVTQRQLILVGVTTYNCAQLLSSSTSPHLYTLMHTSSHIPTHACMHTCSHTFPSSYCITCGWGVRSFSLYVLLASIQAVVAPRRHQRKETRVMWREKGISGLVGSGKGVESHAHHLG